MSLSKIFKSFTTLAVAILSAWQLNAVPVYPKPVVVRQPDGTNLTVRMYGDERFSYATTSDGYNLVGVNGVMYYAQLEGDKLVSTGITAKDPAYRNDEDRRLLNSVSRLVPYGAAASAKFADAANQLAYGASPAAGDNAYGTGKTAGESQVEQLRSLVIIVDFNDMEFSINDPRAAFDNMLNQAGYSENGATGSASDYYISNSNGKFDPQFDVVGPFTLPESVFYYAKESEGHNDPMREFVQSACDLAEESGVDFTQYVVDGILRDVFIFFAGYNNAEAPGGYIHPARMFYRNGYDFGTWGGGRLLAVAYTSELKGASGITMAGIGTFCHEFGHILGWPDFYDTDYAQNGTDFNLDVFSLMASGSYVNGGRTPPAISAYERYMVDWAEPEVITEPGEYTLGPVYDDKGYMIKTMNEGEFFIFEYRNGSINVWDSFLETGDSGPAFPVDGRGSGMLVYHVDRSDNRVGGHRAGELWDENMVNAFGDHECMRLVMASKVKRLSGGLSGFGKMFFPGTDNVADFTSGYSPYFVGWDGFTTGLELYNIKENGSSDVTFEVKKLESGTMKDLVVTPGQFNITVKFVSPFNDTYTVVCTKDGGNPESVKTTERIINFTGLEPATEYTVSVFYEDSEEPLETRTVTTEALDPASMPSLDVAGSYKESDHIVLNYRNITSSVSSVKWSVNNKEVSGTVIKLAEGKNYKIMAQITTDEGVEYFVKYVNVN